MKMVVFVGVLLSGFLVTTSALSGALSPEAARLIGQNVKGGPMTLGEVQAMPPACHAIGMGTIDGVFWAEGMTKNGTFSILGRPEYVMAKGAVWFHHYCWGMLDKHRAFTSTRATDRAFRVGQWRKEMEYIVNWTDKIKVNWEYLPLIHKEIAESYMQEKDYVNALRSANTALALNADLAASYALVADVYVKLKDKTKALDVVTEGLKHVPNSKALQSRYQDLGGSQPFPAPYAKVEPAPTIAPDAATPLSQNSPPETPLVEPPDDRPPGNPYCRFCP